jgi:Carboxypeptidase regulatory-like domain
MRKNPGVISGTIRNPAGNPVPGARAFFTAGPGSFPDTAALTDGAGGFALSAPTPGSYEIQCVADGYKPRSVQVTVAPGEKKSVRVVLDPA